jgi:fructose-1,6-bisphosphatase/inositol monophosphatase family enzyme
MTRLFPDTQKIADIVRAVAQEEALPRFKRLAAHEVSEKSPGDLLTVADEATEAALERRLMDALPGSRVVGEEAVSRDGGVLEALQGADPCWIVDPIDGTINFAKGLPLFATMVALAVGDELVGGWIYDPVHDVMAAAEKGAGAALDGRRIELSPPTEPKRLSGCLHLGGYDRELAANAARNFEKVGPLLVLHTAGIEYQMMLFGRLHYALYTRTNPWDHAPGQVILSEAGGYTARLDGTPFSTSIIEHSSPMIVTAGRDVWEYLRSDLFELT